MKNMMLPQGWSVSNTTTDNNATAIDVTAQYLFYSLTSKNIWFYFGAGPSVGIGYSNRNQVHNSTNAITDSREDKNNNWSVGILGSAGVEWFFSDQMSLQAEYGISYRYLYSKTTSVQPSTNSYTGSYSETKTNNFSFGSECCAIWSISLLLNKKCCKKQRGLLA